MLDINAVLVKLRYSKAGRGQSTYLEAERAGVVNYGDIKNPERARQLNIFKGLSSDGVEATDIDGLIEYKDRAYVIYEVKGVGAKVPLGQKLALERFVNDAAFAGKAAIVIVAEHNVDDYHLPVMVKDCNVREIYCGTEKIWRKPKHEMTAGQLTDIFLRMLAK